MCWVSYEVIEYVVAADLKDWQLDVLVSDALNVAVPNCIDTSVPFDYHFYRIF